MSPTLRPILLLVSLTLLFACSDDPDPVTPEPANNAPNNEPGCTVDTDCDDGERCDGGMCVPVMVVVDTDEDGVPDGDDNCPSDANPEQDNLDGDDLGDACDTDADGDGAEDDADNCPGLANMDQADADGDGTGDACDLTGSISVSLLMGPDWIPENESFVRVLVEQGENRIIDQRVRDGESVVFEDVPDGAWTVRTSRAGFSRASVEIVIDAAQTAFELDFEVELRDLAAAQLNMAGQVLDRAFFEEVLADEIQIQGADFTLAQVRGDLSGLGLDLTSANFSSATFRDVDMTGVVLNRTNFSQADLAGARFVGASMDRANFTSSDLRGAVFVEEGEPIPNPACDPEQPRPGASLIGAVFAEAEFTGGVLDGIDMTGAVLDNLQMPEGSMRGACLRETFMQGSNFVGMNFAGADLTGVDMAFIFLSDGNLTDAIVRDAALNLGRLDGVTAPGLDLTGSICARVNLTDADLTGAQLVDATFTEASLSGLDLTGATILRSPLDQANLSGATLPIGLTDLDLNRAMLVGVDLSGRDLSRSDLSEADLSGANLENAVVEGADFTDAVFDDDTVCLDGQPQSDVPACGL